MKQISHYLTLAGVSVAALSPLPQALCRAGMSMNYGYAAAVIGPAIMTVAYLTVLNRKRENNSAPQVAPAIPA